MMRHAAPDARGAGMARSRVETEAAGCDPGDGRLDRRLGAMPGALGERPGKPLPAAVRDRPDAEAPAGSSPAGLPA
ncbi:transposase DNA-binding-containing protein, partial [Mangrovicoccus sp. HB161399]|uniref:IS4/Tn5 family transposase DNA-binding protein n=1 Tax=Mangrovicoccus sp. HB161399 TaxID=2720392 RepID=UPI00352D03C9